MHTKETSGAERIVQNGVVMLRERIEVLTKGAAEKLRLLEREHTKIVDHNLTYHLRDDRHVRTECVQVELFSRQAIVSNITLRENTPKQSQGERTLLAMLVVCIGSSSAYSPSHYQYGQLSYHTGVSTRSIIDFTYYSPIPIRSPEATSKEIS